MVQRRLTVGSAEDPLEAEADEVADDVVRVLDRLPVGGPGPGRLADGSPTRIRRRAASTDRAEDWGALEGEGSSRIRRRAEGTDREEERGPLEGERSTRIERAGHHAGGEITIRRKTVPKLVGGRVRWYDDTDPEQTLFDTEEEASAAAVGGGFRSAGLQDLDLLGGLEMSLDAPIVNTWDSMRGGTAVGGAPLDGGGGSDELLPIFDIRNSSARPAERRAGGGGSDPTLAYFREFADAGPLGQVVLLVCGSDVAAATTIMRHLVPGVRSLDCAFLVQEMVALGVPGRAIDGLMEALADVGSGVGAFVPIVRQLVRICSPVVVTDMIEVGLSAAQCATFAHTCDGATLTKIIGYGLRRADLASIAESGLLAPGMTQLARYERQQVVLLLQVCDPASLRAAMGHGFSVQELDRLLQGVPGPSFGPLMVALVDFGATNVIPLCRLISPTQLVELVTIHYTTRSARSRILSLVSVNDLCSYVAGAIGVGKLMPRLLGATTGAEITVPIAALGQPAYAFLLSKQLKPAEISGIHQHLIGVGTASMATAITNLKDVQRWKRLLQLSTPHACLADLVQFGPNLVETWSYGAGITGQQIGLMSACIAGAPIRAGIGGLLTSGLPVADLVALCGDPTFGPRAGSLVCPSMTGATVSANLATLSVARYVRLLVAQWNATNIDLLVQAFLLNNAGRSLDEWVEIAEHGNNQPTQAVGFCAVAGWNAASIGPLLAAFTDNANGLTVPNWVTVASHVTVNDHAAAIQFAQLYGWTWAGIQPFVQAFHANPNGLSADNWITLTYQFGGDAQAQIIPFAQLANWSFDPINQLVVGYASDNPNNLTAANWVTIAQRENPPNAAHAIQVARGDAGLDIIMTPEDRFQALYPGAIRIGSADWQTRLAAAIGNGRQNVANRAMNDTRHVGAMWPRANRMSHWTQGGNTTLTGFVAHVNNVAFFVAFGNHAGPNTYNITWHANGATAGPYEQNQVTI